MNLAGNTQIIVNGKATRVCGRQFNQALKDAESARCELLVLDMDRNLIVPSKGLSWRRVAETIRSGKKVTAKVEKPATK